MAKEKDLYPLTRRQRQMVRAFKKADRKVKREDRRLAKGKTRGTYLDPKAKRNGSGGCVVTAMAVGVGVAGAIATWKGWA